MFEGSVEILIAFVAVLAAVGVVTMIIRAMNVPVVAADWRSRLVAFLLSIIAIRG
jgi:hypothetical protein